MCKRCAMQHNTQDSGDNLWRKEDVLRKAQVSMRTVDYWIEENLIPYIKFRKAVRFIPADVDAFIVSQRVAAIKKIAGHETKSPARVKLRHLGAQQ